MNKYDNVELTSEIPELAEKNIHKGCNGKIIEINGNTCKVFFYAPRIYGDYAVATVDKDALEFTFRMEDQLVRSFKDFIKTIDESKHTRLLDDDVHEYDEIEMTAEKKDYAKEGVHKGMQGTVMSDVSYDNKWYVIFTKTDGSGEDIADINVHRDDFKIIYKSPVYRNK